MKEKTLKSNVAYNFIYTSLNLLFPIITAPYVSRILGASLLGRVNFATVVVNWFILFATFGTTTYGIREISRNKNDKVKIASSFSEIVFINALFSLLALFAYVISIFTVGRFQEDPLLFSIFGLNILFNILNIDWFFQGIEEYKYITVRNAIVKIISLISIFVFVRNEGDYYYYGVISVLVMGCNSIFNYVHSRKIVNLDFKNNFAPWKHIRHLSVFFFHTFLVNIYTNFDQLIVGFLIGDTSVAFLNRAKILINMCASISTSVSNATLPRAAYYRKNDREKFSILINKILNYNYIFTLPMTFGVMILSRNIMFIMGGSTFLNASSLLIMMAPVILFSPISNFLQYQVLVSSGKEKAGLIITLLTSLISLVLNISLIPLFGVIVAGIVQSGIECFAVLLRYRYIKKNLIDVNFSLLTRNFFRYLFSSLCMLLFIFVLKEIFELGFVLQFILCVPVGVLVYGLSLYILKDELIRPVINGLVQKALNKR